MNIMKPIHFPEVLPESPSPLVELEEKDPAARSKGMKNTLAGSNWEKHICRDTTIDESAEVEGKGLKGCKMLQLKSSFYETNDPNLTQYSFFLQGRVHTK